MKSNCGHIDSLLLIDIPLYFRWYYTIFFTKFQRITPFCRVFTLYCIMRHLAKRNTAYTITAFNDIVKNSCCTNMSDTLTNTVIHKHSHSHTVSHTASHVLSNIHKNTVTVLFILRYVHESSTNRYS